jgi:hypothetical protein
MTAAKTKTAARKAAKKKAANAKPAPVKASKKKSAKKSSTKKQPSLTQTVNLGPERGDNSWPPSAKKMRNVSDRAPGTQIKGTPANDSTRGPGGKATEGDNKGDKGGRQGKAA